MKRPTRYILYLAKEKLGQPGGSAGNRTSCVCDKLYNFMISVQLCFRTCKALLTQVIAFRTVLPVDLFRVPLNLLYHVPDKTLWQPDWG